MAVDQFANFARSTIAGGAGGVGTVLGANDTLVYLQTGDGAKFPANGPFNLLFGSSAGLNELTQCTAHSGDIFTIVRGTEGTTKQQWAINTTVAEMVTAANMNNIWTSINGGAGHIINVTNYSATGTGTTDDTAAIQAAINACPAGGSVYFPAGTYLISSTLQFRSGRTYYGDTNQVFITQRSGANLPALAASYEWYTGATFAGSPTFIRNLGFDGNSANNIGSHGLVVQAWQSHVNGCWFKNIPQTAVVIADQNYSGGAVTNSIVENRLYDLKIAGCGQYGIWVQNFNAQCTDGRIENCDINSTVDGMLVDRAAGWYIENNHVYNVSRHGYTFNNAFATFIRGNQVAVYGQNASATGFLHGIALTILDGYPCVLSDNVVVTSESAANGAYAHLVVTANGASNATAPTSCVISNNEVMGSWVGTTHGTASQGLVLQVQPGQVTSGQPVYFQVFGNSYQQVQVESVVANGVSKYYQNNHSYNPIHTDGNLSVGAHLVGNSSSTGVTLAAGAAAGGTPPAPASVTSRDVRGWLTFGTGTTPTAGVQVIVTFVTPYSTNPIVVLTPQNGATAALQPYVTNVSTNQFAIGTQVAPAASQANTTYALSYVTIQ